MIVSRQTTLACLLLTTMALGCGSPAEQSETFALPPGDAKLGETVFLEKRCYDCHEIPGVDLPMAEEHDQALVALGGKVTKVRSYNELVTSIINPSHRLADRYNELLISRNGVSNMTNYNQVLTVAELIDLVAYLESHYEQIEAPADNSYPLYYP